MPLSISPFVCFLPSAPSASRDSRYCCVGAQVGKGRLYTPIQDDIGSILKCEVVSIDAAVPFSEHGKTFSLSTQRVRPTPSPPKRALAPVNPAPWNVQSTGRFTALTYNLLADLYATVSRLCLGYGCDLRHDGASFLQAGRALERLRCRQQHLNYPMHPCVHLFRGDWVCRRSNSATVSLGCWHGATGSRTLLRSS